VPGAIVAMGGGGSTANLLAVWRVHGLDRVLPEALAAGAVLCGPAYHRLVADGFPGGYAADDGAALHFSDGELVEVVASRPGARAYRVERTPDGVQERPLPTRHLG
jgi:peptidase E